MTTRRPVPPAATLCLLCLTGLWLAAQQTRIPARQTLYEFGPGLMTETDPVTGVTRVSVAPIPLPDTLEAVCTVGVLSCQIRETPAGLPSRIHRLELYRNGLYQTIDIDYRWQPGSLEFAFIARPVMAGETISIIAYYR